MRNLLSRLLAVALAGLPIAGAADWPQWRGPNADGISPETGINKNWAKAPPKILWRVPMHDNGFAGPAVADGKVLIIDHRGSHDIVRAIDLHTGRDVWTFRYLDSPRASYGFARATPAVSGGRVYTLSRFGLLHCLELKDGKKVWMRNIVREFGGRLPRWQMAISPLIDGDKLILVPGGRTIGVVCLDRNTGRTIWKGAAGDKPGYATPVKATLGGTDQYVVFMARSLIGVHTRTGRILWKAPWRTSYDVNAATPIVAGDHVFVTSGYGTGCALFRVSGSRVRRVWRNRAIQSHWSTPILYKGHVYGSSDRNRLVCLELKTGRVRWEHRGVGKGGVVGVDGVLIAVDGGNGTVTMVELTPERYRELGRIRPLGGKSWTAPIVADGKLILRNTQHIACIDLK